MEYAYAALLLHESGEELNEDNISRVLDAARVDVEESRVKALVAALEDVDINEAITAASSGDIPEEGEGGTPEPDVGTEPEPVEDDGGEAGNEEDGEDDGDSIGDLFG